MVNRLLERAMRVVYLRTAFAYLLASTEQGRIVMERAHYWRKRIEAEDARERLRAIHGEEVAQRILVPDPSEKRRGRLSHTRGVVG